MERTYAEHYALLEGEHWWFRARRLILRDLLTRLEWPHEPRILEIGVGPGCNLAEVYPAGARLEGVEPDQGLATFAAKRSPAPVFQAQVDQLPSEIRDESYDGITMFDVLEHIRDDAGALEIVHRKLKPGGRIVLSAPAYRWLWGQQDIVNQHCRRYTLRTLREKLKAANFTIERATYFNTFLFPPIALVRLAAHFTRRQPATEGDFAYVRRSSNAALFSLFAAERIFLRFVDFPVGVSVFAAARKDSS
ncbi:MAG: class I SAM-dependent methyltransferase [Verrucomicrobia bacterium]|nr:class I SAM-dependent methyltransferase [Verrucomicrobiota bacterium]